LKSRPREAPSTSARRYGLALTYQLPNNITKIAFARKPKRRARGREGEAPARGRPAPRQKGVDPAPEIC